jgi:selenoprotein W-related protein
MISTASRERRAMTDRRIAIHYCRQCRWLLRAAWMAQELLLTFEDDIAEVALIPGIGGIFEVRLGAETLWSRKDKGRFPEIREIKQLVRDRVAPERDLGHSERPVSQSPET